MANTTGVCILCNKDVTEEDHRREIDCPSKTCPGRIYHEDCIATYLRRTKYSKDRCTGFPCPAILQSGKPCPGYVCKMHVFFPSNAKKKQARLQAAIAAAAVSKPKPAPVKPAKAEGRKVAQVAIAAMKRTPSNGVRSAMGLDDLPSGSPEEGGAFTSVLKKRLMGVAAGVNLQSAVAVQRARGNQASQSVQLGGKTIPAKHADNTVAANPAKASFSKQLYDLPPGWDPPARKLDTKSTPNNDVEPNFEGCFSPADTEVSLVAADQSTPNNMEPNSEGCFSPADTETPSAAADQDEDPVVEYDMLYAAADGSYLVLDALSNAYFRLEDFYGTSPELLECAGEDGNKYLCVVVRKSQIESRARWQQAWFEAQELGQQNQELKLQQQVEEELAPARAWDVSPRGDRLFDARDGVDTVESPREEEADDNDVASLMQLLLCA